MQPRKRSEETGQFLDALSGDAPTSDLSILCETAMRADGRTFSSAQVLRGRRGLGFRVTIELPRWAREHVNEMEKNAQEAVFGPPTGTTLPEGTSEGLKSAFSTAEKHKLWEAFMEWMNS